MSTTDLRRSAVVAFAVTAACAAAVAQTPPKQVVKPPVAQAWVDVATFSGFPMGGMGMGGGGIMNATLGSLMGGGKNAKAEFGNTQTGVAGHWMDVTLYTSRNPNLAEALQGVPDATGLAPSATAADSDGSYSRCSRVSLLRTRSRAAAVPTGSFDSSARSRSRAMSGHDSGQDRLGPESTPLS